MSKSRNNDRYVTAIILYQNWILSVLLENKERKYNSTYYNDLNQNNNY
jgi:hypothetical protein